MKLPSAPSPTLRSRLRGAARGLAASAALLATAGSVPAIFAQAAPPRNLVPNGNFERVITFQNLYDGVDANGTLRVPRASGPVYLEGATMTPIPFAAAPCFVDVNGDKLPDIVCSSPLGSLYWFPNSGKKGAPTFDRGHLAHTYLGTGSRACVADVNGDGKEDVVFGNIEGLIFVLSNRGSVTDPRWTDSMAKPRWMPPPGAGAPPYQKGYMVETLNDDKGPIDVGNYSAPCWADWNKDGIPDLVVGEGSYSANSMRVWINQGSKTRPIFRKDACFFIAYGEGREQLTPAVMDWNNDGIPDLLVGDREGRVALYLGTAEAIKDSKNIKPVDFTKFLTVGGRERIGYLISISVCDWNDDGIPDLMYGTTSGMIMVALGKGKREDPELDSAIVVKGVDAAKDFKQPSSWEDLNLTGAVNSGWAMSMQAPLPEVVSKETDPNADIKEGNRSLHVSWFEKFWGFISHPRHHHGSALRAFSTDYIEGAYSLKNILLPFVLGKDHELSFQHRGEAMKIVWIVDYVEKIPVPGKPPLEPWHVYFDTVSPGKSWGEYRKTIRLEGTKESGTDTNGKRYEGTASLYLYFVGTGNVWVDDVKLIEVVK
ncbi:MAG: VCBS repeat-containing protein [Verrucomicrobiae bacterium]|nr:VCBS repeat-containing protein [Verrucomicrobiae bacterium]